MIDPVKVNRILKFQLAKIMYWDTYESMIRLEITENCDLHCKNCNKFCGVARSTKEMTLDQVQRFVDEARAANKQWRTMFLTGGETTLHTRLNDIFDILYDYCEDFDCYVGLLSHKTDVTIDSKFNKRIIVSPLSGKTELRLSMKAANISPIDFVDLSDDEYEKGCGTCKECGYGFSIYGYYMCPVASAVDRLVGADLGAKTLQEIPTKTIQQRRQLCKHCAMFFCNAEYTTSIPGSMFPKLVPLDGFNISMDEEYFSPSKKALIDEYNISPKPMTLY